MICPVPFSALMEICVFVSWNSVAGSLGGVGAAGGRCTEECECGIIAVGAVDSVSLPESTLWGGIE
jgi:hypothetical protein